MKGKIIKGIAGFYYVYVAGSGIYECKAKGIFRKEKIKPLVGDNVEIEVLDEKDMEGNIIAILPRHNELIRPAVANIDQAMIIFAAARPNPNFNLLDRFLLIMEKEGIPSVVCFNKKDLAGEREFFLLEETYRQWGENLLYASAKEKEGIEQIKSILKGKTTAVAGPSGVGKSSIINLLQETIQMDTGAISEKIGRGKHTTRHSELIPVDEDTYVMDTPGFSNLYIQDIEKEDLKHYFREFESYENECKFLGCTHTHEPGCKVKAAVSLEKISRIRYDNYVEIYEELKDKRRY